LSSPDNHITLSELTQHIKGVINAAFASESYWVIAEISGHKMYMDGDRHYFDFVEKADESSETTAKIRGIAWREGSESIKSFEQQTGQIFKDGIEILARVKVEYQIKYGIQLILLDIDQNWTLGNLEKQRQATLARLVAENPDAIWKVGDEYITTNKKAVFNAVIQNIAIIGSPNSEGYKDFIGVLEANQFNYRFDIDNYQSAVQGAEAHAEIVSRLVAIYQSGKKYDCVVIIRGGGAKTDFLVFDNYLLAKAAARFPIPIITGIGHSTDISIVDMMVNTRTNTPTKAAEFVVLHNRNFEDQILNLQKNITIKTQRLLASALSRITTANLTVINNSRLLLTNHKDALSEMANQMNVRPRIAVAHKLQELENVKSNMHSNTRKYLANLDGYLNHYQSLIRMAKPESILKRGFAIVSQDGKPVGNPEKLRTDSQLKVIMHKYDIETKITAKRKRADGESYL
tara:strand:- start:4401 stop:5777 length:1377 start_codon:yes stop_codon:yes gene_type:complete